VHLAAARESDLQGDVRRRSETEQAEASAGLDLRAAQRAVADDAGAEERRGRLVGENRGDGVRKVLAHQGLLRITAVLVPAGVTRGAAQVLVAAPAVGAGAAGEAQPGDPHALADREPRAARAERLDGAHHLVAGHERQPARRQVALDDVQIGAAHAAGRDPHAHLAGAGPRLVALARAERRARRRSLPFEDHLAHGTCG
jgi:hypothetical protein